MAKLAEFPVHLGLGATAVGLPRFTGDMAWYQDYAAAHAADGAEARLVSMHGFSADWTVWEMHPLGAELVVCTAGRITLIQEQADGAQSRIALEAGDYAINPPGVWHTADVAEPSTALFVTAGLGTEHRAR